MRPFMLLAALAAVYVSAVSAQTVRLQRLMDEKLAHSQQALAADRLAAAAIAHDLDEAALAYADLTLRCVGCHRYVQRARLAR